MYTEEDLLPLSGLQHLEFCPRQWALIHIERQWAESDRTVEGKHLHERSDDPFADQTRGDVVLARAVPLVSRRLGLTGVADAVEFHRVSVSSPGTTAASPSTAISLRATAASLPGREGLWLPRPVEYKRGESKPDDRDQVQVCAQAMCLEEMLSVIIPVGDLFYAQTRHRTEVIFDGDLRRRVETLAVEMHALFRAGTTPPPIPKPHCRRCSLIDLCLPKLAGPKTPSVAAYLRRVIEQPPAED